MDTKRRKVSLPLTAGFAALLVLTTAGSAVTLRKSFAIFNQLAQAHEKHDRVADALLRLRSDLYLAGILKRDFLLDRSDEVNYGEEFARIQTSTETNLNLIEAAFGFNRPTVKRLRSEVTSYMSLFDRRSTGNP